MNQEDLRHTVVSLSEQLDAAHDLLDTMGVPREIEGKVNLTVRGRLEYLQENFSQMKLGVFGPYFPWETGTCAKCQQPDLPVMASKWSATYKGKKICSICTFKLAGEEGSQV